MLENARIDCFHFVEHLDFVVGVRDDTSDGENADQEEEKQDHEYKVNDEQSSCPTALLTQV